jgi:hypothetical protein
MEKVFLLFFCLFPFWCLCQKQDYISYHQHKVEAEQQICKLDFDKALQYYEVAFSSVSHPFIKDLYNATICAALTSDTIKMIQFLEQCLKNGVNFSLFENNSYVFGKYMGIIQWHDLKNDNEYQVEIGLQSLNNRYKSILDSLSLIDQNVRSDHKFWRLNFPNSKIAKKQKAIIRKTDSINTLIIKQLVVTYGYPNEKNIGIWGNSLYYFGSPCVWHIIDQEFMDMVEYAFLNGEIDVERYVAKMEYAELSTKYHYLCFVCQKQITPIEKEKINTERKKIGFPTFEEMLNIERYFQVTRNVYKFSFNYAISIDK